MSAAHAAEPACTATPAAPCAEAAEEPARLEADQIDGVYGKQLNATGNAVMVRQGQRVEAEWIQLFEEEGRMEAGDHTRAITKGSVVEGGRFTFRDGTATGEMSHPTFTLTGRKGRGDAVRLLFEGEDRYSLQSARYTTCEPGREDWMLKAFELEFDYGRNLGVAHHTRLEFYGVPLVYFPWADFTLDGSRKSGILPPSFGTDSVNGIDLSLPYYFNLAPNYDFTFRPRNLSKRGVQLGGEFRYLTEDWGAGIVEGEYLSNDRLQGSSRSAQSWVHQMALPAGWNLNLNLQRASDDAYFRDLENRIGVANQSQLPREAVLSQNRPDYSLVIRSQRFQTLQDPLQPVSVPYDRLPQVALRVQPQSEDNDAWWGGRLQPLLQAEAVSFSHSTLTNGDRVTLAPSLTVPLARSWGYIKPKLGVNARQYQLRTATGTELDRQAVTTPIFSVDSGLFFERDAEGWGRKWQQTLEPRLMFTRIPYRDQSALPSFDSGVAEMNYGQLFAENDFTGGDRINNTRQLTAGLTSRFIEDESGAERLRMQLGQRYYFEDQQVTLPGIAARDPGVDRSDLLASVSAQVTRSVSTDLGLQFKPASREVRKANLDLRYQPAPGSVASVRYRFTEDSQRELDLAGQWPLGGGWYGVARHNYSFLKSQALESVAGVEYNAGCWVARTIGRRYLTASNEYRTSVFLQLEFTDLGRLGSNPLEVLANSIPGYSRVNSSD